MWGSSGLELSSAWTVFRVGSLRRLMLWFLRNVARNSPTCISNIEIASLEFCGFLDTYEKLGYPNYVRVLVDEAPKANSCVRSSSHDTVHNPRDASNTTPTPHNAKSRFAVVAGGVVSGGMSLVSLWLVFVGGLGGIATIGAALRRVVGVSVVYGRKIPRVLGRKGQRRVPVEGSMVVNLPCGCSKCSPPR